MKELVRHLWKSNREEIVERSLLNCHVKGLHSIMLLESPGKTIRMYIALPDNELFRNRVPFNERQTLGFHGHHCDITIHVIRGAILNSIAEVGDDGNMAMGKYLYKSPILSGGVGYFEDLGTERLKVTQEQLLRENDFRFMPAHQMHTVSCSTLSLSAWLVYEGKEDKNYIPYTYSFADLTKHTNEGLYKKPTETEVFRLLNQFFPL